MSRKFKVGDKVRLNPDSVADLDNEPSDYIRIVKHCLKNKTVLTVTNIRENDYYPYILDKFNIDGIDGVFTDKELVSYTANWRKIFERGIEHGKI